MLRRVDGYLASSQASYETDWLGSIGLIVSYVGLDPVESVIGRWRSFDDDLAELSGVMRANPAHVPIMHQPAGEYNYIIGAGNLDGSVDFDNLSERTQRDGYRWDPDFFLSSVNGAPEDIRQAAYDVWLEDAIARTPIYSSALRLSGEVTIKFVEIGADLAYRRDEFDDGRVQLTFEVSGNLGVAFNAKAVDASAGVEGGFMVMHEFDSAKDADAFMDRLMSEAMPDGWDAALALVPGGLSVAAGRNISQVVNVLSENSSLESCVASVGIYGELEMEVGEWMEANAGLSVGYGRDFVSDENILYLEFDVDVEFEMPLGSAMGTAVEAESGFDLTIAGEQRWGPDGDSFVDLELTFGLDAGFEFEHIEELMPGLDLGELDVSGGVEFSIRAYLELDDSTAERAWKDLLNPLDGKSNSRDMLAFLDRAGVTAQVSAAREVEHADIDWWLVDVEMVGEERRTQMLWAKAPGDRFRKVTI